MQHCQVSLNTVSNFCYNLLICYWTFGWWEDVMLFLHSEQKNFICKIFSLFYGNICFGCPNYGAPKIIIILSKCTCSTPSWYIKYYSFNSRRYDCNGTRTHNQPSMAKWLSVRLQTKWLWVWVPMHSLKLQISHLSQASSSLTFRQLCSVNSLWNAYLTW